MYDSAHPPRRAAIRTAGAPGTDPSGAPRPRTAGRAWRGGQALYAATAQSLAAVGAAAATPGYGGRAERSAHHTAVARWHDGPEVAGRVTAVDGSSTAGTCGTAGGSGSFTLRDGRGSTDTVAVRASTVFVDRADTSPSDADVCVGTTVAVTATAPRSGDTLRAGTVLVVAPRLDDATTSGNEPADPGHAAPASATSTPTPVWGSGATDSSAVDDQGHQEQGTLDGRVTGKGTGTFTLVHDGDPRTVSVTSATSFSGPSGASSLDALGLGDVVQVVGTESAGTFTATSVTVVAIGGGSNGPNGSDDAPGSGWIPAAPSGTTATDPRASGGPSGSSPCPTGGTAPGTGSQGGTVATTDARGPGGPQETGGNH